MESKKLTFTQNAVNSKGLSAVMELNDKLQHVFTVTNMDAVQMPQIVVVGSQSSGKSSVLESIVRRSFLPRGTGMVTKCPIILRLINRKQMDSDSGYDDDFDINGEYIEFGHRKGHIFRDYELVKKEILAQTELLAGKSGISNVPISIDVHSPHVVNLTLVDLPGMVKVVEEGEPDDIEKQVESLIKQYISNRNSIILAVCPANTDIKTAESLKMAKEVDPSGDRTLAIVTKLDLMDDGTDARNILMGNCGIKVKLGIIGVVNRSARDLSANVSVAQSIQKETAFLQKNYRDLADRNGTIYLENTLALLLRDHIIQCLPQVMAKINEKVPHYEKQLSDIGGDEIHNKSETMLQVITDFHKAYNAELEGSSKDLEIDRVNGAARVRVIFTETLAKHLATIDPLKDISDLHILRAIMNSRGYRHTVFTVEDAFQRLVKPEILKVGVCAQHCANLIHNELLATVQICLDRSMDRFPRLNSNIEASVTELLNERISLTKEVLEKYIKIEASYVKSSETTFVQKLKDSFKELDVTLEGFPISEIVKQGENDAIIEIPNDFGNVPVNPTTDPATATPTPSTPGVPENIQKKYVAVRTLIDDYFKVVRKQAQDFIPRAIAFEYIDYSVENVLKTLIKKLYPQKADELIRVSDHVMMKRDNINRTLMGLKRAQEIINEAIDTDILAYEDEVDVKVEEEEDWPWKNSCESISDNA